MNIDDLTLGQLKEIASLTSINATNKTQKTTAEMVFEVGKSYLVRTVTHINLGRVERVVGDAVILSNSSWVADTGRFHDALKCGPTELGEVEPYVSANGFNFGSVVDWSEWIHDLPMEQK